jgi:hypothetical protein
MFPPNIEEYGSGKVLAIASHVRRYAFLATRQAVTNSEFFCLQVVSGYAYIHAARAPCTWGWADNRATTAMSATQ